MNVSNVSIIEAEPLTKKQLKKQRQAAKVTTAVSASPKAKTPVLSSTVDWSFAKDVVDELMQRREATRTETKEQRSKRR
jgi:hypothetical protein